MKHHITGKQAEQFTDEDFYRIFSEKIERDKYNDILHHKKVTIGKLMEVLRTYHQMDIYTVGEFWCIQLFYLDEDANDAISCLYENSDKELIDVLFNALLWAIETAEEIH